MTSSSDRDRTAQAHLEAARTLQSQGQTADAEQHYRAALETHPDHPAILFPLGLLCFEAGRFDEAAYLFEKVRSARPDLAVAHLGLGNALNALGQPAEARSAFEKVLSLEPSNSAAHFGIGHALQSLGRMKEARRAFEHAVDLAPKFAPYHRALAEASRFGEHDPRLAALEELAREEASFPEDQKIELHFALAKAYDDLKRHDLAFAHFKKGNDIKRRFVSYDEAQEMAFFEAITMAFTPELLAARRGPGNPSDVPVFVVGMPRSGTTLIEQVLASHPCVFGAGELMYLYKLAGSGHAGAEFPFDIAAVPDETLRRFGGFYVTRVRALAPQAKRIVDKLPLNFRLVGLIRLALPNARIIHVRRDPLDTCLSCYFSTFSRNIDFTYDLGELGRYYKAYDALMAHWRAALPTGAMLEVQYENLVTDFETEARRMVEYCGLEWDARCLDFHETRRVVHTVSAAQVHQPLYQTSIGRWLPYKAHLRPLLDALGAR